MADPVKVVKFGGSSLADAEHFRMVQSIVTAEESRRYVVPSAPGKRFKEDDKVTDLLYQCYEVSDDPAKLDEVFARVIERYELIIEGLGMELDLSEEYTKIKNSMENHAGRDYAASRGEYLNGIILAKLLGYHFLDPARVIRFAEDGSFDAELTNQMLGEKLSQHKRAVIPGFYGSMPNGTVKTFSRGGSDITGSIVARAANAAIYENWTDVSGFMMADPRIIDDPHTIEIITYRELRELSYMGATVLHEDAIFPVRLAGIPINIRNTNDPACDGTVIVPSTGIYDTKRIITGIAGKTGFSVINIEKDMMNSELGFGRRVLEVFEKLGISFEHLPSGVDTMGVVVNTRDIEPFRQRILDGIRASVSPDSLTIEDGLALIAVVGRGMVRTKGTAAKLFKACAEADVNIRMIDQGSSEFNIIIGVEEGDFIAAQKAIYNEFVK
ncbi:MAG: aspartate kinase [Ruminococcaceae bacterium]|nr:aspartate kinase [Oscillospiraceae bacterium]